MRLSNETRYPHPVLSRFTGDYSAGDFSVAFSVEEAPETSAMVLKHKITLEEPNIARLVENGQAEIACLVRCLDTYHISKHPLGYPEGKTEFPAGQLINTVIVRPIIFLKKDIEDISSELINEEFGSPIPLKKGDILALDSEVSISAGKAKLAKAESIFELHMSEEVPEGRVKVNLELERISIFLGPNTFSMVNQLRNTEERSPIVMNSVYLPAVMETLDLLKKDQNSYTEKRWYTPLVEKCIFHGYAIDSDFSILDAAYSLLESPLLHLAILIKENDYDN